MIKKISRFLIRKSKQFLRLALSLLFFPFSRLLYVCGFRIFGCVHIHAMGHLAIEPDVYLRKCRLEGKQRLKMILLAPTKRIRNFPEKIACNHALLNQWSKYFYVVRSPLLYLFFLKIKCWRKLQYNIDHYVMNCTQPSGVYTLYRQDKGSPFVQLDPEHISKGRKVLERYGIKKDDWFVCFHARDHDFYVKEQDSLFTFRNADINTLFSALEEIEKAGGWCIRMGDAKSKPLDYKFQKLTKLLDYTKTEYVSDWMDLFLAGTCRFFVGGSSGLSLLPSLFNIPCVHVNMAPFCHPPLKPSDLTIPKLYFKRTLGRLMTFSEITHSECGQYLHHIQFEKEGIEFVDNTEEEIREVVLEMIRRLNGSLHFSSEQMALREKLNSVFQPDNFCYGFGGSFGMAFLEKYKQLLSALH